MKRRSCARSERAEWPTHTMTAAWAGRRIVAPRTIRPDRPRARPGFGTDRMTSRGIRHDLWPCRGAPGTSNVDHDRERATRVAPGPAKAVRHTHLEASHDARCRNPPLRHRRVRLHAGDGVPWSGRHPCGAGPSAACRSRRGRDPRDHDDDLRDRRPHRERRVSRSAPDWSSATNRSASSRSSASASPGTRSATGSSSGRSRPAASAARACPGT